MNLKEGEFRLDSKNRELLMVLDNSKKLENELNKKKEQIQNLTTIVSEIKNEKIILLKTQ